MADKKPGALTKIAGNIPGVSEFFDVGGSGKKAMERMAKEEGPIAAAAWIANAGGNVLERSISMLGYPAALVAVMGPHMMNSIKRSRNLDQIDAEFDKETATKKLYEDIELHPIAVNGQLLNLPFSKLFKLGANGQPELTDPFGLNLKKQVEEKGLEAFIGFYDTLWADLVGKDGVTKLKNPVGNSPAEMTMAESYVYILEKAFKRFQDGSRLMATARAYNKEIKPVNVNKKLQKEIAADLKKNSNLKAKFNLGNYLVNVDFSAAPVLPWATTDVPWTQTNIKEMRDAKMHTRDVFDKWFYKQIDATNMPVPTPEDGDVYRDFMTAYEVLYEQFMQNIDPKHVLLIDEENLSFNHRGNDRARKLVGRELAAGEAQLFEKVRMFLGEWKFIDTDEKYNKYLEMLAELKQMTDPTKSAKGWSNISKDTREWLRNALMYFNEELRQSTGKLSALIASNPASPFADGASPGVNPKMDKLKGEAMSVLTWIQTAEANPKIKDGPIATPNALTNQLEIDAIYAVMRGYGEGTNPMVAEDADRAPGLQQITDAFAQPTVKDSTGKLTKLNSPIQWHDVPLNIQLEKLFPPDARDAAFRYLGPAMSEGSSVVQIPLRRGPNQYILNAKGDIVGPQLDADGKPIGPHVDIDFGKYFTIAKGKSTNTPELTKLIDQMGTKEGDAWKKKKFSHDVLREEFGKLWREAYIDSASTKSPKENQVFLEGGNDFPRPGQYGYEEYWEAFYWFRVNMLAVIDPDGAITDNESIELSGKVRASSVEKSKATELPMSSFIGLDDKAVKRLNTLAKAAKDLNAKAILGLTPDASLNLKNELSVASDLPALMNSYTQLSKDIDDAKAAYTIANTGAKPMPQITSAIKKLDEIRKQLEQTYKDYYLSDGLASILSKNIDSQVNNLKKNYPDITEADLLLIRTYQEKFPPDALTNKDEKDMKKRQDAVNEVINVFDKLGLQPGAKAAFIKILQVGDPAMPGLVENAVAKQYETIDSRIAKLSTEISIDIPNLPNLEAKYAVLQTELDTINTLVTLPSTPVVPPAVWPDLVAIQNTKDRIQELSKQIEILIPNKGIDLKDPKRKYQSIENEQKGLEAWIPNPLPPTLGPVVAKVEASYKGLTSKFEYIDARELKRIVSEANIALEKRRDETITDFEVMVPNPDAQFTKFLAEVGTLKPNTTKIKADQLRIQALLRSKIDDFVDAFIAESFPSGTVIDDNDLGPLTTAISTKVQPAILSGLYTPQNLTERLAKPISDQIKASFSNALSALTAPSELAKYAELERVRDLLTPAGTSTEFNDIVEAAFEQIKRTIMPRLIKDAVNAINGIDVTSPDVNNKLVDVLSTYSMVLSVSEVATTLNAKKIIIDAATKKP